VRAGCTYGSAFGWRPSHVRPRDGTHGSHVSLSIREAYQGPAGAVCAAHVCPVRSRPFSRDSSHHTPDGRDLSALSGRGFGGLRGPQIVGTERGVPALPLCPGPSTPTGSVHVQTWGTAALPHITSESSCTRWGVPPARVPTPCRDAARHAAALRDGSGVRTLTGGCPHWRRSLPHASSSTSARSRASRSRWGPAAGARRSVRKPHRAVDGPPAPASSPRRSCAPDASRRVRPS
jgi:hypothetical protein